LVKIDGGGKKIWEEMGLIWSSDKLWDTANTLCGYIKIEPSYTERKPVCSVTLNGEEELVLAGGNLGDLRIIKIDRYGTKIWDRISE
jgi:hypothetical protein